MKEDISSCRYATRTFVPWMPSNCSLVSVLSISKDAVLLSRGMTVGGGGGGGGAGW